MRRLALAALLVAQACAPLPAFAGADLDGSNDRISIGTCGTWGADLEDADGWSVTGWLTTSQTTVCSLLGTFSDQVMGEGDFQTIWMFGNAGYSSDYTNSANSVLLCVDGSSDDAGFVWRQTINSPDWNDGNLHHHALTAVMTGNNSATYSIVWYVDGQAFSSWTKPWNDAVSDLNSWNKDMAIGAGAKFNAGNPSVPNWFDHCDGTYADWRMYTRALSAAEVTELYRSRGRDAVTTGLFRRWSLQTSDCHELMAGATCTAVNGPTFSTAYELDGVRRR
jgi:hypothetical protein